MTEILCRPIGTIHSPFKEQEGMPSQPTGARDVQGSIDVDPAYAAGLKDLDGFSHIYLLYHFHRSKGFQLRVVPFLDQMQRGLFSTRAPRRPNAIGLSVVRLISIDGPRLQILDVDVLDGAPLLDIKPYVPAFDAFPDAKVGWLTGRDDGVRGKKSDERFVDK